MLNRNQGQSMAVSVYREFRPPRVLAEYLLCSWTQTISSRYEFPQRVLPDCCIDIVIIDEVPIVVGPWTKPFVAHLAPGTNIIGARCHPGLASSLLGMPASELLNQSVPLCDVFSNAEAARFLRVGEQPSLSARMSALESALMDRVANAAPVDKATRAAVQWIARHPRGRIEQLGQWLGLSSRQIRRRFIAAVGYGPKLFQSVLRFQRLLNLASAGRPRGLAEFATEADYADQAHMTREVQRFSGKPPGVSLQSPRCTLRLSGLMQITDNL